MKIATVPTRGAIAVLVGLLLVASVGASDAQGGAYVAHVRALVDKGVDEFDRATSFTEAADHDGRSV